MNDKRRNCKGFSYSNTPKPKQDKQYGLFLNAEKCREWYTARPELIHYDLDIFRDIQLETGERLVWGFDLTTENGYSAALDRIHYLTFNNGN